LASTTLSQRNQEIHDLVLYHLQSLIAFTPDTPIPFEPALTATPITIKLPIGNLHVIKVKVVNLADDNKPVSGYPLSFYIDSGPHQGMSMNGTTDDNGEYEFKYLGEKVGKDIIVIEPVLVIPV